MFKRGISTFLKQHRWLLLIIIAGGIMRLLAINADPFLHPWDERFHALVARNMMKNPWVPMLKKHLLNLSDFNSFAWCCNGIWLHKQPLFLWQMALSMKLFGTSLWAMRFPSALMGTAMIPILYRMSILLTGRKAVGLWAAALLAFSFFHLELISGIMGMDHNDVAHGYYVLASLWCWLEWRRSRHWGWALATGLFAGGAVLNKWLTGLLVYLGWGILAIWAGAKKQVSWKREWLWMLLSLGVCIAVFLPWQLYTFYQFPNLAAHEMTFNQRHIFEVVEGHSGGTGFYLNYVTMQLGIWGYVFPLAGIALLWVNRQCFVRRPEAFALLGNALFVYCFFSFVVQTKLQNFLFFIVPILFILGTIAWVALLDRIKWKPLIAALGILLLYDAIHPAEIARYLSPENAEREARIYNAKIYKSLSAILPPEVHTVMNMNSFEDIDVLFYNDNITAAHHWTVSPEDLKKLEEKKIPIAFFEPRGNTYWLSPEAAAYPFRFSIDSLLKPF